MCSKAKVNVKYHTDDHNPKMKMSKEQRKNVEVMVVCVTSVPVRFAVFGKTVIANKTNSDFMTMK